jgi:hypothetical protein
MFNIIHPFMFWQPKASFSETDFCSPMHAVGFNNFNNQKILISSQHSNTDHSAAYPRLASDPHYDTTAAV